MSINEDIINKINHFHSIVKDQDTNVCAVIKTRSDEEIQCAIDEGNLHLVGENHVQELLAHYEMLKERNCRIHFIGHLQTNKVKYIIDKVDVIESLDSLHLADEIEKQAKKIGRVVDVLVEVNIAEEEQKSGVAPSDVMPFVHALDSYAHLNVIGLMTVGPVLPKDEDYQPYFCKMRSLFENFKREKNDVDSPILSMGMSNSYACAMQNGSNEIRIGSGIFGPRIYKNSESV